MKFVDLPSCDRLRSTFPVEGRYVDGLRTVVAGERTLATVFGC